MNSKAQISGPLKTILIIVLILLFFGGFLLFIYPKFVGILG